MFRKALFALVGFGLLLTGCSQLPQEVAQAAEQPRLEFTRMIVHWRQYLEPGYLEFVEQADPEIVQVGFYGADFWTLAHLPDKYKGLTGPVLPIHAGVVTAEDPRQRLKVSGDYFENLNAELHQRGAKVIGHFDVAKYLLGDATDPNHPTGGFFTFYRELWDEQELGPKPVEDPMKLLAAKADGTPIITHDADAAPYAVYYGCLANPLWREVLKRWVKRGIERGVDGFQINYFYRQNCTAKHCQRAFKDYLRERFTSGELLVQFGIRDLDSHVFEEIVSRHDLNESTPLRREMQRFSDIANKEAFDEVFIEYGRSLKPDLIVSQWLHSSADFAYPPKSSVDERMMLPSELWGKGEDYLWYCVGKAEPTLQLRYIRGAFDDKPFTVCHYENVKIRASFAELAANGGAPMAKYINFPDPLARKELLRYYDFMKRYEAIYRANRPHSEAVLLHPRSHNQDGRFIRAMTAFQEVGRKLMDEHVLFDAIPDEIASPERVGYYRRVYTISDKHTLDSVSFDAFSRFEAPATVRVSASHPAEGAEIDVHFVNYNREEGPEGYRGKGIADENPIPVSGIKADLILPEGFRATRVEAISPEAPEPLEVEVEEAAGRIRFTMPEFLVYGVARVYLEPSS